MNTNNRSRPAVFLVARREILMRLRSRIFALGTIGMVALVAIGIAAASILGAKTPVVHVGFADGSQTLEQAFAASASALGTAVTVTDVADASAGKTQVTAGTLDVLVIGPATSPTVVVKHSVQAPVEAALEKAVLAARLTAAGLPPAALASAIAGAQIQVQILEPSKPDQSQNAIVGLAVGILLYVSLGIYGSFVAQGVVEEKATRIMEILLATIRPSSLLAGKVVGIGLVGLLQLTIVGAAALIGVALTHVASIPGLSVASILGDLVWFLLGFLLYATAYASVAALVSRQEEVSGAIAPISLLMVGGYLLVFVTLPDPGSMRSTILSLLPPFAPVLMSVRMASGDAPMWQVGLAMALTLASILGLTWLAGRVYANSALRLGTRVRFWDALRG